jgi:hypothetical protein
MRLCRLRRKPIERHPNNHIIIQVACEMDKRKTVKSSFRAKSVSDVCLSGAVHRRKRQRSDLMGGDHFVLSDRSVIKPDVITSPIRMHQEGCSWDGAGDDSVAASQLPTPKARDKDIVQFLRR